MHKGLSIPLVIIFLSLFTIFGLAFFGYEAQDASETSIKGVRSGPSVRSGFTVALSSTVPWEFLEYLCTDMEECESSLESGKKYASINGGSTDLQEIDIPASPMWNDYRYIKIFMRSAWGAEQAAFRVDTMGNEAQVNTVTLNDTKAVIIPIEQVRTTYSPVLVSFSNNQ